MEMKYISRFSLLFLSTPVFAQNTPNVVVIVADDLGVGDVSKYRGMHTSNVVMHTPNIDKLANDGVAFTNAYACSALSATSRYGLMTGNYNYRSPLPWGVWSSFQKGVFNEETLTLGKLMKKANYSTAFIGKWHLGTQFTKRENTGEIFDSRKDGFMEVDITKIHSGGPSDNGFDYNFTLPSGIQNPPYAAYENDIWYPLDKKSLVGIIDKEYAARNGFTLDKQVGLGDSMWNPSLIGPLIANKAVDYIRNKASKGKPFFLYYCSQAVHSPHCPPDVLDGIKIKGTTPSAHMDMVKELDVQVKMIVDELKRQNVYDNTIIIFTSDNGGLHTDGETWSSGHEPSDIYRGCKGSPFEGGCRVPFIVSWPKVLPKNHICKNNIVSVDIMATLSDITGIEIEKGQALDSYSILPLLLDNKNINRRNNIMLQTGGSYKYHAMYIEDGWKLIIYIDPKDKTNKTRTPIALFDLKNNIKECEENNFIDNPKYKKKVQYLFNRYNQFRDEKLNLN